MTERITSLERLAQLRATGVLSEDEFASEKARLLNDVQPATKMGSAWKFGTGGAVVCALVGLAGILLATFTWNGTAKQPQNAPQAKSTNVSASSAPAPTSIPSPTPSPIPCIGADCADISPRGWGGIASEMSVARAQRASGLRIGSDSHYDDLDYDCRRFVVRNGPKDLTMLVENGIITSFTVFGERYRTARGIHVGSSEVELRQLYSPLRAEHDIYGGPKDKLYFFDVDGGKHGFNFGVTNGKVGAITFGGSSRGYVEGCL